MTISIRNAVRAEWPEVVAIHRRAIHEIAIADYPPEVLNAWGPPITEQDFPELLAKFDEKLEHGQVVIVAEINGTLAGFGELVPERNELLALYVNPDFNRQGVGTAILLELERIARDKQLSFLQMKASLTAVPFYKAHGFKALGRDIHVLQSGAGMDCVKMRKDMT